MTKDMLVKRITQLLQQASEVMGTLRQVDSYTEEVDIGKFAGYRSASLSFIERVYGVSHTHYVEFNRRVEHPVPDQCRQGIFILETIRDEIAGDWLFNIKSLITAEVFADFIEMAEYLLEQDYKDAAAVIAGSVLEEHLRQLCIRQNIPTSSNVEGRQIARKADVLNSELAKSEVYTKLDQKSVTAWLDLRNNAAHGKYELYDRSQVSLMIAGIANFVSRHSA